MSTTIRLECLYSVVYQDTFTLSAMFGHNNDFVKLLYSPNTAEWLPNIYHRV